MRQLAPGIYVDAELVLHFNVREMCDELGWPYTRENIRTCEEACLRAFTKVFGHPPKRVVIFEVPRAEEVN